MSCGYVQRHPAPASEVAVPLFTTPHVSALLPPHNFTAPPSDYYKDGTSNQTSCYKCLGDSNTGGRLGSASLSECK